MKFFSSKKQKYVGTLKKKTIKEDFSIYSVLVNILLCRSHGKKSIIQNCLRWWIRLLRATKNCPKKQKFQQHLRFTLCRGEIYNKVDFIISLVFLPRYKSKYFFAKNLVDCWLVLKKITMLQIFTYSRPSIFATLQAT